MKAGAKTEKRGVASMLLVLGVMLLLCVSIVQPAVDALGFGTKPPVVIAINLCLLLFWSGLLHSRRTRIIALIGAALAVVGVALWLAATGSLQEFTRSAGQAATGFFQWVGSYMMGNRVTNQLYADSLTLLLSALVTMLVYLSCARHTWVLLPMLIGSGTIIALALLDHPPHWPGILGTLGALALLWALAVYRKAQREAHSPAPRESALILCALPMAALAVGLAAALAFSSPIQPGWANDLRQRLKNPGTGFTQWAENVKWGAVFSGGELGGNVVLKRTNVFDVKSTSGGLYLRGTTWNVYTGHSWEQSVSAAQDAAANQAAVPDDTHELLSAAPALTGDADIVRELVDRVSIAVTYKALVSRYVYAPLKSAEIDAGSINGGLLLRADGTYLYHSVLPTGLTYHAVFYHPKVAGKAFGQYARQSHAGWYEEAGFSPPGDGEDRSICLQLPSVLPARVEELAREITAGQDNDYDKARALESYLSSHYSYTLTPGERTPGADFVEDFLFEKKEGYCTYFATSMAVMLRCIGIPARYVEGFVLPPAPDSSNVYHVTNQQCHAWVEAYFEGLGWMQFDPTGGPHSQRVASASPSAAATPTTTQAAQSVSPAAQPQPTGKPQGGGSMVPLAVVLIALLLAAAAAGSYFLRQKKPTKPAGAREEVLRLYELGLRILAAQGLRPEEGETPSRFAARADAALRLTQPGTRALTSAFEEAQFSTHRIGGEQCRAAQKALLQVLQASRKKLGPVRTFYFNKRISWHNPS